MSMRLPAERAQVKRVFTNQVDWVVARSGLELLGVLRRNYSGADADEMIRDFREMLPGETVKVMGEDGRVTAKTAARWAAESDVGVLCSTEF